MRRAPNFIAGILISNRIGHFYLLCGHQEIDKIRKYGIVFSSSRHNTSSWIYRNNHGYRCYLCYCYTKIMLKLCIFILNPCLIVFAQYFQKLYSQHIWYFSPFEIIETQSNLFILHGQFNIVTFHVRPMESLNIA